MRTYYTSYAGLGVIIDAEGPRFRTDTVIPSCLHPSRTGNRFCPECGKQVVDRKDTENTDLLESLMDMVHDDVEMPDGYLAAEMTYPHRFFVGFAITSDSGSEDAKAETLPTYAEIKARLNELLGPLGLYDDSSFGLYSLTIEY